MTDGRLRLLVGSGGRVEFVRFVPRVSPVVAVDVAQVKCGMTLLTPKGVPVKVYKVDKDDGRFWVRWWRPAKRGEPGEHLDGKYLGSFRPMRAGELVRAEAIALAEASP